MTSPRYLFIGSGFITSHLAKYLLSKNSKVKILYRVHPAGQIAAKYQKKIQPSVKNIKKIIINWRPDYILITQGVSFIPHSEKDLEKSIKSNLLIPVVTLQAAYQAKQEGADLKRIMTFGSWAEHDKKGPGQKSELPSSLYGLTKHWLYSSSKFYASQGLPCLHLRLSNLIGAGQHPFFVVSSFCRQVARMEKSQQVPILKVGDIEQSRDFMDIRDFLNAFEIIQNNPQISDSIEICTGKSQAVANIVTILKKASPIKFKVEIDPGLVAPFRTRHRFIKGNPAKLASLGWRPRYKFVDGVLWTLNYWRNHNSL